MITNKHISPIYIRRISTKILSYLCAFIAIFAMSSCVSDSLEDHSTKPGDGENQEVVFKVNVPYSTTNQSTTRAISENNENRINSIYMLVFKVNPDGTETYDYFAEATRRTTATNEEKNQYYTVKVRVKKYQQRFVAITNAEEQVKIVAGNQYLIGKSKEEVLSQLEISLNPNEKWDVVDSSNFKAFPMWGESSPQTIVSTTTQISDKITLMRMVARIDVQLDSSVEGISNLFKIKSVHLFNTNVKGALVPAANTIQEEIREGKRYSFVKDVTIPSDIQDDSKRQFGPLKYTDFTAPGMLDMAMTGAIYTFETKAPSSNDMMKATALVIGGYFENDTKETYYRVDFLTPDRKNFLDVKRNHRYLVNIVNIKAGGHETPEEAFESKSVNMETEILFWNEGDIGDWVFGEHYNLGVGFTEYELDIAAKSNILQRVSTNAPKGWKCTLRESKDKNSPELPSDAWVKVLRRTNNGSGKLDELYFEVSRNDSGAPRTAYMHITAYNFTVVVPILQKITESFFLNIDPEVDYFDFYSGLSVKTPVVPKTASVNWGPSTTDLQWTIKAIGGSGISFDHAANGVMNGGTGSLELKPSIFTAADVDPKQGGNPFLTKESRFEVTLENDRGGLIKKTIGLRQTNYTAVADANDFYVLDGKKDYFTVKANTPWTAKLITTSGQTDVTVTDLHTTAGVGNTTIGEKVYFTTLNDIQTLKMRTSIIRISSVEDKFDDIDVFISGGALIWVKKYTEGYIPASTSSDMVYFADAQGACPEGYIVPTIEVVNAWKESPYALPSGGDHWIDEFGYREKAGKEIEREAKRPDQRLLELTVYATSFNEAGAYNFLPHTNEVYVGTKKDSKVKVVFKKDKTKSPGYTEPEEFEKEYIIRDLDEPQAKARVRCVKRVV